MPKINRNEVYQKYNGHCAYCGREIKIGEMQVDHMWPQRRGGTDEPENLFPSCRRCNHYKRAGTLEYFRKMLIEMRYKVLGTYLGKVAEDYGMVEWKDWDGEFYFEKVERTDT